MLVNQTNSVGVQLFSYVNTFFCSNKFAWLLDTRVNKLKRQLGSILVAVGDFLLLCGGPKLNFRRSLSRTAASNRAYGWPGLERVLY